MKESSDRRTFLADIGKTAILLGATQPVLAGTSRENSAPLPAPGAGDFDPVKLTRLEAASEKTKPPLSAPLPRLLRVGFAVIGLGHLSLEEILPAIGQSKYARLVAIVSGDRQKAEKVARQYDVEPKNIYNYQNFDDIRNNAEVQVVYIVLPNGMHEEFCLRAAKAGKHVLCEKPMTVSSASAQRMINAVQQAEKHLMIAYRIQYEPKNALVKQWVRQKKFGTVKVIEAFNSQNTGDPSQWRLKKSLAGGGCLPDIGLYCLNTARYLLGTEPQWVMASAYSTPGDPRFGEVEESMMFQMGFPDGTQVSCMTHYGVHESRRYRCITDGGAWFGLAPAFSYDGLSMEFSRAERDVEWAAKPDPGTKNQFALELDHMALCVFFDKKPFTPGEEGLQDQRIMEAIYTSAASGKKVMLEKIEGSDVFRGTAPDKLLPGK